MQILPRQLLTEEFNYYAEKPVDDLRDDMQQLFEKTRGLNFYANFSGKFTSSYAFEVKPTYRPAYTSGFGKNTVYLVGKISQGDNNHARVTILVRPNAMFIIVFFVSLVWGLYTLAFVRKNGTADIIINLVFILLVPFIMVVWAYFAKKGIKDRFVKVFGLRGVENK